MFSKSKKYLAKGLAFVLAIGGFSALPTLSAISRKEAEILKVFNGVIIEVYPDNDNVDAIEGFLNRVVRQLSYANIPDVIANMKMKYRNNLNNLPHVKRMLSFIKKIVTGINFQSVSNDMIVAKLNRLHADIEIDEDNYSLDALCQSLLGYYQGSRMMNNNINQGSHVNNNNNIDFLERNCHRDKDRCLICLDDMDNNNENYMVIHNNGENDENLVQVEKRDLICNQNMHKRCLAEWLRYNKKCPLCRSEIDRVVDLGTNFN